MSNPSDVEDFLIERAKAIEESERIQKLVKAYKKVTPIVIPVWDTTPDSIQFNDISPEILESGINIYTAPFDDVWTGIYEPGVYDRSTLWKDIHGGFG